MHVLSQVVELTQPPGRGFDSLRPLNCCDEEHIEAFKDLADYSAILRAYNDGYLSHVFSNENCG